MMNILSLGAGVQSSTLLLMALAGELTEEFGPLDSVIFADTGAEPQNVYQHVDYLAGLMASAGIPFYRVSAGNLIENSFSDRRKASIPLHVLKDSNESAIIRRQCTSEYKIDVIRKQVRVLIGLKPRQRAPKTAVVTQWIGISTDEAYRMTDSKQPYITHLYPLIERGMSRNSCLQWLRANGFPQPPKSSCIICPYHKNRIWRDMRDNAPEEWATCVDFDRGLRDGRIRMGQKGLNGQAFLHRSLIPLSEVDLSTERDHGQIALMDDFGEECEGVCGV